MKKQLWNTGWTVAPGMPNPFGVIFGDVAPGKPVLLPQDAMVLEERTPDSPSGNQTGYYPVKSYTYERHFTAPEAWRQQRHILALEGVMAQVLVYLNGELVCTNRYGYSVFYADLDSLLRYGQENTLQIQTRNFENGSRWYPGSGIYRDVWLLESEKAHVEPDGVRLTTESLEDGAALVFAQIAIRNDGLNPENTLLCLTLTAPDGRETSCTNTVSLLAGDQASAHMRLFVDDAALWSPEEPNLYRYTAVLTAGDRELDRAEGTFGIRTLQMDARHGLRINGVETKLRGACIHQDHGVIGSTTLPDAEAFKVQGMKAAGFNAIRSAHHPASPALLDACDRLGMLVMDELTDMWELPKNTGDYALDFTQEWKTTLARMVAKDWNHPSVVLYSLGNEIPEIGRRNGGRRNRELANTLRTLDPHRFITCSISGFLAMTDRLPEMTAQMADTASALEAEAKESAGSEALNAAMAKMEQRKMDAFSTSKGLSEAMEEVSCELDVVGYNYLTARHEYEHTRHPERVVVGSETYPTDIARLWGIVRRNHHVIGDFTWTGWDYLGEAGLACYHYTPERRDQGWYPDRLAYCGDIDLNAHRRPMSYLREVAYGLRTAPYLCVERVDRYGQPDNTNDWKYYDAISSWTFPGWEDRPTVAHVFSASEEVELFQNGVSLGRKPTGEAAGYDVSFSVTYHPGELTAVGYTDGKEDGRYTLQTAGGPEKLRVTPDKTVLTADGRGAAFLTVELTDAAGNLSSWESRQVTVTVEGAAVLAGLGSADPQAEGSYQSNTWPTFDGRLLAVVRAGTEPGPVQVRIAAEGCDEVVLSLECR